MQIAFRLVIQIIAYEIKIDTRHLFDNAVRCCLITKKKSYQTLQNYRVLISNYCCGVNPGGPYLFWNFSLSVRVVCVIVSMFKCGIKNES